MPDEEVLRAWRELEAPDPLADVPARYLSASGFAERLLRLIAMRQRAGDAPGEILAIVRMRCMELVMEGEEQGDGR